jgi:predicted DNA-binding mobile mystery protein A
MRTDKLARMQLDKQLNNVKFILNFARPIYGWIKTIRNALGMTSRQFAKRIGVTQARASAIETGEMEDSLTLKSAKEAATALNCKLVYFLIPEKSLEKTVSDQAIKFVKSNIRSVVQTMGLENQGISPADSDDFIKIRAEEILQENAAKIWDID